MVPRRHQSTNRAPDGPELSPGGLPCRAGKGTLGGAMGVEFFETMTGSFRLDTRGEDRPLSFTIRAASPRLSAFLRAPLARVEGEMHSDAALSTFIRDEIFPNSRLKGQANLLVMPGLEAANIAFNMLKVASESVVLGPILLGAARSVHIVTPSITVRGLLNMSAIALTDTLRTNAAFSPSSAASTQAQAAE